MAVTETTTHSQGKPLDLNMSLVISSSMADQHGMTTDLVGVLDGKRGSPTTASEPNDELPAIMKAAGRLTLMAFPLLYAYLKSMN